MKTLFTLAMLAITAPVFAGHGVVVQQVRVKPVVQRQRVVVQQVRAPRQRVVVQQVVQPHVQQFVAPVYSQQFVAPVQQFNAGCHNGALQLNAGGCQALFAH